MATRAATFTAKIRNLKDYHHRVSNNMNPQPSGIDIANTLKYFAQTLLSVLKDVPLVPQNAFAERQVDSLRLSVFPNLNYSGLYDAVINIIDIVPGIQYGQHALGQSILSVLGSLVPFIEYDVLDELPLKVANTLAIFPQSLQEETMYLLCNHLLPITLGYEGMNDSASYATDSTPAIIMVVLQYVESQALHSQVIECIMSMKKNVCRDLLCVIAYGPPAARPPAAHHLFHYWPQLNPSLSDTRLQQYNYTPWEVPLCQKESCPNNGTSQALKMCFDPCISIECGDRPPPIFICADCVELCRRDHMPFLVDVLKPMQHVAIKCENKNCHSVRNQAVSSCFSAECRSMARYGPMRYCQNCHDQKHKLDPRGQSHIFHLTVPDIWTCPADLQSILMEAIVSLLKEVEPLEEKRTVEMGEERRVNIRYDDEEDDETEKENDRMLLSRYGIWLLVDRCRPKANIPIEILGRLLAMLFQWFDATAYLPDDGVGTALERLKHQYICKWLAEVAETHLEVILSCLLPHPVEYARVGGHWDTLSSRTSQIREGLNRLFCLIPYDIVTFEVWDYVIPFWLEAIHAEVPMDERQEVKVLLRKLFDNDMGPLPFNADKMYNFVSERFNGTTAIVQEQNLAWLQILTSLDIIIPLDLLVNMFKTGIVSLVKPASSTQPSQSTGDTNIQPFDHLKNTDENVTSETANNGNDVHFALGFEENSEDIKNVICFVMMLDLILMQVDLQNNEPHTGIENVLNSKILDLISNTLSSPGEGSHVCQHDDIPPNECDYCEVTTQLFEVISQVIQHIAPKEELKIPPKELPKVGEVPDIFEAHLDASADDAAHYDISQLPSHIQLLHSLLMHIEKQQDADAIFFLLKSVNMLILHAECFRLVPEHEEAYISHTLKHCLIPNMWKLLQSEHCQLCTLAVSLLLYAVTLPTGAEVFWLIVENDFNNEDWRARFSAVDKVTVLCRLLDSGSVECNQQLMTSLAHAFCCLIGSVTDINSAVVQRALAYIHTIKRSNVQCLCHCLEYQFDSVIKDRTMILQKLYLLSVVLKDNDIFTWEFFLNRFDSLCLEAQLDLESNGDITSLQDLQSSDRQSDTFLRKINRARFALARTDSIRSVSYSVYAKVPYRRAASVPIHLLTKTLLKNPHLKDSEKAFCTRQQSAPQFRSRGSRFGLGMFSNYIFPGGHLREFTDEESNFAALLQRAMDLEGVDCETIHQLVSLLMKFMVYVNNSTVSEDRGMGRAQNIVLRHLNVLLGYNQTEKAFSVPPYKLRYSAVFNAFMILLPDVLDKNFDLGNIILPVSMALLQYCPSPQRYASDYQPPNYTLWYLDSHTREAWLHAVLIILYKYQYNISPASSIIHTLVRICINTVSAQLHYCRSVEDPLVPQSPLVPRTRDLSTASVGDGCTTGDNESLPSTNNVTLVSPTTLSNKYEDVKTDETDAMSSGSNQQEIESPPLPLTQSRLLDDNSNTRREAGDGLKQSTELAQKKIPINQSVDSKIAEQLLAFESHSRADDGEKNASHTKAFGENRSEKLSHFVGHNCSFEKKFDHLGKPPIHLLEDVKESDEEWESQKQSDNAQTITEENGENELGSDESPPSDFKPNFRQRKARKTGLTTVELQNAIPELGDFSSNEKRSPTQQRRSRRTDYIKSQPSLPKKSINILRVNEQVVVDRCIECNAVLEKYDEETISLAIACLATFIHREPALAAPLLLDMLQVVARVAASRPYPWQTEIVGIIIPGNSVSVARQFLRCSVHQLAPNGIIPQIFLSELDEPVDFLRTLAATLTDFTELTSYTALQLLLEGINDVVEPPKLQVLFSNLAIYLDVIPLETSPTVWTPILSQFEIFFRRIATILTPPCDMQDLMRIMITLLRVPGVTSFKGILEPFSKLISMTIQMCKFKLQQLMDICCFSGRAFTKERDKLYLCRTVIFELIQALKFKLQLPDDNLMLLVQFVLVDAGGTVGAISFVDELVSYKFNPHSQSLISSNASDCMKQHLGECVDFIADIHTISKVKSHMAGGGSDNLNEDTVGSQLKAAIAQYVSLEFTKGNGRDHRALSRHLPWLYHPPTTLQQGPREFIDCVSHIRLLCWLLLGSLNHLAITAGRNHIACQPLPLEASSFLADHIMVILTGFAEQSKASVLHMSSLFHAFMLCQLWTLYCEANFGDNSEVSPHTTIMDFWSRVTPGVLQLLSHSQVLSEMVNLHFLSLIEALQECNLTVLHKLFPMWTPLLHSYHHQLPGHMQVRLQVCQNWKPKDEGVLESEVLVSWLKRLQFKLGQIEIQSSQATQFYCV